MVLQFFLLNIMLQPFTGHVTTFSLHSLKWSGTHINRRFHGRGRHLVGRAKNSDRLGRVTFSLVIENGGEQVRVR